MKVSHVISAPRLPHNRAAALAVALASFLPLMPAQSMAGQSLADQSKPEQTVALESHRVRQVAAGYEGVAQWLNARFSQSEIDALSVADFGMEAHHCSCADQPKPHFPYRVVLFTTPKGDLVARAEAHEHMPRFTPLAVRKGEQYCQLESEEQCYGSFASVCEFTDFRYGPTLKPYFPTCK